MKRILIRAGFAIIANAIVSCGVADSAGEGTHDGMTPDEIEKLFLSLA